MNRIAEIIRAVMAALGRLVGRVVTSTKKVGGKLVTVTETVFDRVHDAVDAAPRVALDIGLAAGKLAVGAASDIVKAPFRLAVAITRGRPAPQAPQEAAAEAEQAAVQQQARADQADDARQVLFALRKVAQARAAGQVPDAGHVGRLPQRLLEYVEGLSRDECDVLARRPTTELRSLLAGKSRRTDVRSPEQVAAPAAVVDIEAERAARRDVLRAAVRGAMTGRKPTVDEIVAEARRA